MKLIEANSPPIASLVFGRPLLPDRAHLIELIDEVLASRQLSNGGLLHNRLEHSLSELIGQHVCLTSSGTMALMMALRLGNLKPGGEVITSPLSFAASAQAIEWCGFKPVFADVERDFPTLDPLAVEKAITPQTVAILGVHFMGIACDTIALEKLARRHKLWLVFDGAQTPDIQCAGEHLAQRGDVSIISLHATKLLNTAEGGAIVVRNAEDKARLVRMRNFGLSQGQMQDIGINGKLSEIHAAMGLAALPLLEPEISARKRLRDTYVRLLSDVAGVMILKPRPYTSASLLYFALSMPKRLRLAIVLSAAKKGIVLRDSFSLLCGPNTLFQDSRIVSTHSVAKAHKKARRLLALPMHSDISESAAKEIVETIKSCAENHFKVRT